MTRRFFGTDGVRGPYGGPVINEGFAARLGAAAARWMADERRGAGDAGKETAGGEVLIGWDTRESGVSLAQAVARGLRAGGVEPVLLGVVPTPAVSRAVRDERAALGVVITASHNPAGDNGIKFFGAGGVKLTDEQEAAIETRLAESDGAAGAGELENESARGRSPLRGNPGCGRSLVRDAAKEYAEACGGLLPAGSLAGWRVVLDTANGATCGTSPDVLRKLGAEVIGVGDAPDGRNINAGVGSEHPEKLMERVRATGARLGVAHDGDGDRCVLCDERGELLDGDELLVILATHALGAGRLAQNTLVVTEQSNLGVDAAIAAAGGRVLRTPVGDRYVSARMRAEGAMLGGESSGHIICAEVSPTGDGLVAALRVMDVMQATGRPLSELRRALKKFPQRTAALRVVEKKPLPGLAGLTAAINTVQRELADRGRVLVRYSGTEPKLRLLVEGPTDEAVGRALAQIEAAARAELEVR
jgi:phosphoglucosamine mutase